MNTEIVSHCAHPFFVGGLRALMAGLLIVFYSHFILGKRLSLKKISKSDWKDVVTCSIMLYGIAMPGFSWGLHFVSPVVASFVLSSAPFLTAGLMYILHGETLSKNKTIGLLIGFLAVLVIILGGHDSGSMLTSIHGAGIYLFAMILMSYTWITFKKITNKYKDLSLMLNGTAMVLGGTGALLFSVVFKTPDRSIALLFVDHGLLLAAFIFFTAVCYGLYSYLLTKYSPTFLSFAGFLDPMFATLFGLALGHQFHMIFIFSFIALFAGLYIFYREELKII